MELIKVTKKYGATGLLALALVWFNVRLNDVEERLYKCYDQQILDVRSSKSSSLITSHKLIAILPKEEKVHQIKKTR